MKRAFLFLLLTGLCVNCFAGDSTVVEYPSFKVPDIPDKLKSTLVVTEVKLTETETVISLDFTYAPGKKKKGHRCFISTSSFLMFERAGSRQYVGITDAKGIPFMPDELIAYSSTTVSFSLTYGPVPQGTDFLSIFISYSGDWLLSDIDLRASNTPDTQEIGMFKYEDAVVPPLFQGRSLQTIRQYVTQRTVYPIECRMNNISGRVVFKLMIDEEGRLHPEITESSHYLFNAEAFRVVSELDGFTPCRIFGKPCNYSVFFPLVFKLPGEAVEQ